MTHSCTSNGRKTTSGGTRGTPHKDNEKIEERCGKDNEKIAERCGKDTAKEKEKEKEGEIEIEIENECYTKSPQKGAKIFSSLLSTMWKPTALISENDYKAIQNALESLSEYTLVRILGDYKIAVEVTTAPNVWGIPMLIQVKQWYGNIYSIKNCGTVEEMRWYLG